MYRRYGKRILDLVGAGTGLILLAPVLAGIALLVWLKLGRPIFFTQERPGLKEEVFEMYKFRTMTNERDEEGNFLPDEERLTPLGNFLRSTSLDELPELWNVLRGDMSLVGPRPLLEDYLDYYTEKERLRHTVRPGITGLAQVKGRNYLSWDERLILDVHYVKKLSFNLDLWVLGRTLMGVFLQEGVEVVPSNIYDRLDDERESVS